MVSMDGLIPTNLAPLYVSDHGDGPPVVLFHSLFVDQRSWRSVVDALGPGCRLILIDAPNHGRSGAAGRDFSIGDCAAAATEVLDALGVGEPVHWVGNALGGHVGITLAASRPERVRSLVTIGTPVEPFTPVELWTQMYPFVQLYRLLGATWPVTRLLEGALLGKETLAERPEEARATIAAFRTADRSAMLRAMRCLMLRRRSVAPLLPSIEVPTRMLVAAGGQEGWSPEDAAAAAATMPDGSAGTLRGFGHVAPLLLDAEHLAASLREVWQAA